MAIRHASAVWQGTLKEGAGTMKLGSGAFEGAYSFSSRFEEGEGTNPEELIGAAHAGCFSMFLSALLTEAGFTPTRIETTARVHLRQGPTIALIELDTQVEVPGLDDAKLQDLATQAKENCPVSKALAGPEIQMTATLVGA
ncbi:MAG: OsmC family peroxiredoxin [Caldilineae bacterium]|nr:MAG: OsmC family peroxiredoxin [Caldilineae bacterium]